MTQPMPVDDVMRAARVQAPGDLNQIIAPQRVGFDIRYLVAAVRANLLLIGLLLAGMLALALMVTLLQTPRYTARTTIQINDSSGRILGEDQTGSDEVLGAGYYDTERFLKTQVDVLKSRGLALRVVQKANLLSNPQFYDAFEAKPPSPGTSIELRKVAAVNMLLSGLNVTLPREFAYCHHRVREH